MVLRYRGLLKVGIMPGAKALMTMQIITPIVQV
jgi:hypothetical protein